MNQRIEELEIRLTHQEATIDTLEQTVLSQARELDRVNARLEQLAARLRDMASSPMINEAEETPPPHY